ncbi:hypothetical protein [Nocardia sp. NBC_00403]
MFAAKSVLNAVIVNAVHHAIRRRIREIPLRIEHLLRAWSPAP